MMQIKCLTFLFIITTRFKLYNTHGIAFPNPIRFPYGGPFMGIFLALALPIDLPNYNVFLSYNFEGNYNVPQNDTEFVFPPVWAPDDNGVNAAILDYTDSTDAGDAAKSFMSRSNVYGFMEYKLKSFGYPGKSCLLRAICESALYSVDHNGVLDDMIHILFTPSTSQKEGLNSYENAEIYGREKKHCKKYTKKCSISILGLISQLD